jgi:hypothetical protein
LFYDRRLGLVKEENLPPPTRLQIGNDVWIANSVLIMPGCARIGDGAILAAGAVVTRDVPDFAIVGGNPAKVIRYRFSQQVIEAVRASRWWDRPLRDLKNDLEMMTRSLGEDPDLNTLMRPAPSEANQAHPSNPSDRSDQSHVPSIETATTGVA